MTEDQRDPAMLSALSFTKQEAAEMVGKRLVGLEQGYDSHWHSGHQGRVVGSEKVERYSGNNYEHVVLVEWTDREANTSKPERMDKEQVRVFTRKPTLLEHIGTIRAANRETKQQTQKRGLRR